MNGLSLAQKILRARKPFIFFHTWTVSADLLRRAIHAQKSMDLDVCVDDGGEPYLGHSREYHEKSGEPYFKSLPLWEAVDLIAPANIVVMVDCKHHGAWPVIAEVVGRIGPERCLVCSYVAELKFDHSRKPGEPDYLSEWSKMEDLARLKSKFPAATITPCAKWLPADLLVDDRYAGLVSDIRQALKDSRADSVCLDVPDDTLTDRWLRYFLAEEIIPHVMVDKTDISRLSEVFIGETDYLEKASVVGGVG